MFAKNLYLASGRRSETVFAAAISLECGAYGKKPVNFGITAAPGVISTERALTKSPIEEATWLTLMLSENSASIARCTG